MDKKGEVEYTELPVVEIGGKVNESLKTSKFLKQIGVIYCKSIFCLNTTPFRGLLLQTLHLFL
ncbi:hypothetical protein TSUD_307350 [Trifolium subterraneum]|nr:hypothetical protein TSUD_307350 [Trifolium subterraneum]